MVGIVAQFPDKRGKIGFCIWLAASDGAIQYIVYSTALGQTLPKQLGKGGGGSHLLIPGIAPYLMIQVQAPSGVCYLIRYQFPRSYGIGQKYGFKEFNAASLFTGWIGQGAAAEPKRQNGAVNHSGGNLKIVLIG